MPLTSNVTRSLLVSIALALGSCAAPIKQASPADMDRSTFIGIRDVTLTVENLDRAIDFYRNATGFQIVERGRLHPSAALDEIVHRKGVSGESARLRGPNSNVRLLQYDVKDRSSAASVGPSGPGLTHVCYQSPIAKPLYDRFRAAGARPVTRGGEPVDLIGGGYRYIYSRDKDGAMFEVEHALAPPFSDDVWVGHAAYATNDLDRLVSFYSTLMRVEPYRRASNVSGAKFDQVADLDGVRLNAAWLSAHNMIIEFWYYSSPASTPLTTPRPVTAPGYSMVVYEVGDLEHEVRRVIAAGGQIVSRIERDDGETHVFARDPDLNLFELVQYKEPNAGSIKNQKAITWDLKS